MRAIHLTSAWKRGAALAGAGALMVTYGCGGGQSATAVRAQELAAAPAATPIVVSCEPHQRTLVRPAVVNGATVSQVECVAADPTQAYPAAFAPAAAPAGVQPAAYTQPVQYAPPATQPVQYIPAPAPRQVVYEEPARVVRTQAPARAARTVRTNQVVYEPRQTRSVKKSAIIIGSSAGVGAGVGAAVGGKKGALIGAAIGGGGAAVWDQVTRRKQ